ncbi:glycoside hydrolase [Streptomyces piniterrae]|uniref:Glycoside hydrolase n=2 Tax=Streptomyces piniterrae TaxID=2571125 RepID=A0A4U0MYK3_9ACTN|nr:glycoside hydrolase [Streptomyces piniterrae]
MAGGSTGEPTDTGESTSPDADADTDADADAPLSPTERTPSALLRQLQSLYRKTEESTEAYNATQEDLGEAQQHFTALDTRLAKARRQLTEARADAGRLARLQYQGASTGGLSSYLRILMAEDPQQAMDSGHFLQEAAAEQAATVARLTGAEKTANALAKEARASLDQQRHLTDQRRQQRDTVLEKLRAVEELLASLTEEQLTELSQLEAQGIDSAQRTALATGAVGGRDQEGKESAPSRVGERALAYALDQVGKPYVWGATGPDSFDCSGLTSQAWAHAGRRIPRTSQKQWKELPHVRLNELRPSDLVIYFRGATHVAMYVGGGKVVQAPKPGGRVEIVPIASNPLLGAVRPDPGPGPEGTEETKGTGEREAGGTEETRRRDEDRRREDDRRRDEDRRREEDRRPDRRPEGAWRPEEDWSPWDEWDAEERALRPMRRLEAVWRI